MIPVDAKFVTATQAIDSSRWPFGRNKFYQMVKENLITPRVPYQGARPVYSVREIDALFSGASELQSGGQSGGQKFPTREKCK